MNKPNFRHETLRVQFEVMVVAFDAGHRDLGTPEARCTGNSFASAFWKGYDGVTTGLGNYRDRASRQTLAYACYRAGQYCRARGQS